jgi:hypothetical protein
MNHLKACQIPEPKRKGTIKKNNLDKRILNINAKAEATNPMDAYREGVAELGSDRQSDLMYVMHGLLELMLYPEGGQGTLTKAMPGSPLYCLTSLVTDIAYQTGAYDTLNFLEQHVNISNDVELKFDDFIRDTEWVDGSRLAYKAYEEQVGSDDNDGQ